MPLGFPAFVEALYSFPSPAVAPWAYLVCMLPLSFMAGQSLLAAFPPAPGSHLESLQALVGFPRFYPVSTDKPLSFRLLASCGPLCILSRGCSSAAG